MTPAPLPLGAALAVGLTATGTAAAQPADSVAVRNTMVQHSGPPVVGATASF